MFFGSLWRKADLKLATAQFL